MQEIIPNIRNFSIIAHINHGKSTLADRFLELTGAVEKRKMREQYLDQMDLERERGITIKLQPVRMIYRVNHSKILNLKSEIRNKFLPSGDLPQEDLPSGDLPQEDLPSGDLPQGDKILNSKFQTNSLEFRASDLEFANSEFILNLIDTPGHIDFSYEVSRALKAVEGAVLLVDAASGVQAQTFYNAELAKSLGLVIIPVINKIDLPQARIEETKKEIIRLLGCKPEEILEVSAKTGQGVEELLKAIIERVPSPSPSEAFPPGADPPLAEAKEGSQALIFDFSYSTHQGVIAYIRMMRGRIKKGDELFLTQVKEKFISQEVGFFCPELKEETELREGDIGYVVTNIKKPAVVRVGDTIVSAKNPLPALLGYEEPKPVVWTSVYPESQDDFNLLSQALARLHLSDSSLTFEEEGGGVLGRGFKCGFLGMLHLEIVLERLKREFNLKLITTFPSVVYYIERRNGKNENIHSPVRFPDDGQIEKVFEPWLDAQIITPPLYLSSILKILQKHEAEVGGVEQFGDLRVTLKAKMALREFMRNFFDELKSVSEGYGSLSYKITEMREADVGRLDILVGGEIVPAFSRVVKRTGSQAEAKELLERLYELLPRQLFSVKIQAKFAGRILASRSLSALKKDVTGYLYGGDRTRKMKLWQKQKAGKKRLKEKGKVRIPQEVFLKMLAP